MDGPWVLCCTTDGVDYHYLNGNTTHLSFLSNAAMICIAIEIVDDDLALEGVEEFSLMFNVSDPRIQVGRNTTSTVMILDNDGTCSVSIHLHFVYTLSSFLHIIG